jgi:hypothetical protein
MLKKEAIDLLKSHISPIVTEYGMKWNGKHGWMRKTDYVLQSIGLGFADYSPRYIFSLPITHHVDSIITLILPQITTKLPEQYYTSITRMDYFAGTTNAEYAFENQDDINSFNASLIIILNKMHFLLDNSKNLSYLYKVMSYKNEFGIPFNSMSGLNKYFNECSMAFLYDSDNWKSVYAQCIDQNQKNLAEYVNNTDNIPLIQQEVVMKSYKDIEHKLSNFYKYLKNK